MNNQQTKPDLIVICGPTGIGKTSAGIEAAEYFNGEIIGADSMQVYRYMDIGTAKPTAGEQARIHHHMIDVADPDEPFDAARFNKMASLCIDKLAGEGKVPFLVGGTGLYIKALVHGLFEGAPADEQIRAKLKKEADEQGAGKLFKRLQACDPETAVKLHINDTYRITRALEIYEITGKTAAELYRAHAFSDEPYKVLKIGLHMDRVDLYERINQRVDIMIDEGLLDEVKRLIEMGYSAELKSMQSIGYKHMADFIAGKYSWDQSVDLMKRDTRRYAKRQFTWFRADKEMNWVGMNQIGEIKKRVERFLK
ncbi:MAG: tRNA (adenosine(37)-N6)-dimethylallyltransferase MiaA [Desulfobacterales bacterium]|nr:tRNA (adenosine(37)-N6)-dimethylallyltransferase MiaA [Desulfobacterales bacterium]